MRRPREQGFTLLEIMVSMTLLVIGLLGVIALHATSVKGNRMSRELERARVMAGQVMEDLRGEDVTTLPGAYTFDPDITTSDGVTYHRKYKVEQVTGGNLRLITVTVEFFDNDNATDKHTAKLQMVRTLQEKL